MHWIEAEDGYGLALSDGKMVCRNAKGKVLASVPKKLKESPAGTQLSELRDWLALHARECRATVERWMLRSLPVPFTLLKEVWADPEWRAPLHNLLVRPATGEPGFLRDISATRGLGLLDIDGESHWISDPGDLVIPHPIHVEALDEYREVLTELQLSQSTVQLFRECWPLPAQPDEVTSVNEFSEGKFAQTMHAQARAKGLGYPIRGGFACCSVWDQGQVIEARYWVGAGSPEEETWTGELSWVDDRERPLTADQAGPVGYSEGMRMASLIYAGRVVEKEPS